MAKKVNVQSAANWVSISKLFWCARRNVVRSKPSSRRDQLTVSLVDGWNQVNGSIPVENISTVSAQDSIDYVEECLAERQKIWDELKTSTKPEDTIKLAVFESLYCKEDKKGLIKPEFLANACFQRGAVYFDSQVQRFQEAQNDDTITPQVLPLVPVVVREYKNSNERLEDQARENFNQEGAESIPEIDKLNLSQRFFQSGYIESKIRKVFGQTMGQKLYHICKVDSLFPNVKIVERINYPEDHKPDAATPWLTRISFGPIGYKDLNNFIRRTNPDLLKVNETVTSEDEVFAHFGSVRKGKNAPKIMSKESIKGVADQHTAKIVQQVARDILDNKTTNLDKLRDMSRGLNLLTELDKLGVYSAAERLLVDLFDKTMAARPLPVQEDTTAEDSENQAEEIPHGWGSVDLPNGVALEPQLH